MGARGKIAARQPPYWDYGKREDMLMPALMILSQGSESRLRKEVISPEYNIMREENISP